MKKYRVWTHLQPHPEDKPRLKRMWNIVRKGERKSYQLRRNLAHDYCVAKKSGEKK